MASRRNVRPDLILHAIARKHTIAKDLFFTEVKDGPTLFGEHRRIDAIAIKPSWRHQCITGYEVKVNRKDFERDIKWPGYRDMCHKLFFACPAGLIQPEELPEDVGLIWYDPDKRTIITKRAAAFRDIEIPWQMFYYLVISRTDTDRHPFFSSRREYLEAWLEDKKERRWLGEAISTKIGKENADLRKQVERLKAEVAAAEIDRKELKQVKEILGRAGYSTGWGWLEKLEEALNARVPPCVIQNVEVIENAVRRLKDELRG